VQRRGAKKLQSPELKSENRTWETGVIGKKRILAILSMLMTAGLLFAGLWPLDFAPENRAYWLPDEEGLSFDGSGDRFKRSVGGIAYASSPLVSPTPAPSEKGAFTIEIVLKPAIEVTSGVPHILGFIESAGKEVFYLGQWKQSLIVRWFGHHQSGELWMKEIGVRDALQKGKTQKLTIASNQERTNVYLDGKPAKQFPGKVLIGEKESLRGYSVAVGNSKSVKSSWTGTIIALRLYERALSESEVSKDHDTRRGDSHKEGLIADLDFDKHRGRLVPDLSGNGNSVMIPERVMVVNRILAWPDWAIQKGSSPAKDILVNIFGFVPFGFLFAFWREQAQASRRWRSCLLAVLIGTLISVVIEVTQAFIPARDSSIVDLMCNTGGAILGAGLQMARKVEAQS
jgi:hypothetical protein